jgi:RNA polymerase primary sigma factor
MNVQEFQKKLAELCELAAQKENRLEAPEIGRFFEGMDLDQGQLLKVVQYLKAKGIRIEGLDQDDSSQEKEETKRKVIPLTEEEQEYYQEYLKGFENMESSGRPLEELFTELRNGSLEARSALVAHYLKAAGELAVDMNCEEIFLADLISEANIAVLSALEEAEPALKSDPWMILQIRKGIAQAIEAQTMQNYADEQLVEKVQKLEDAIRDLTEEEDGSTSQLSVNELAIILDMEIDEIKDILRLTGDEN